MEDSLDFTTILEDKFYSVVDNSEFRENDAESIYNYLNENMRVIPFCDYLKRYILRRLNCGSGINDYELSFYQNYIVESFNRNMTPKSFTETSTKTSVITKNWLTQTSVNRKVIFLLGFGLDMSVEDVSEFLENVQKEHSFNFKDPFEIVCWYCYSKRLKYPELVRIMDVYRNNIDKNKSLDLDSTIAIRDLFYKIDNENDLLRCLLTVRSENGGKSFSTTARFKFEQLYNAVRGIIAAQYTDDEEANAAEKAQNYMEMLSNSEKISIEEKIFRADIIRRSARVYNAGDISEADVEKNLCCGIPFDENGNLLKTSFSTLASQFSNKRMSRKHLRDILIGKSDVDRFDLISLNFYIHAMGNQDNCNKRYIDFIEDTNAILRNCYMGDMYISNPYECFLMMCMLSEYPMGTYADVLELSYTDER